MRSDGSGAEGAGRRKEFREVSGRWVHHPVLTGEDSGAVRWIHPWVCTDDCDITIITVTTLLTANMLMFVNQKHYLPSVCLLLR